VVGRFRERDALFTRYRVTGTAELAVFEAAVDPKLMAHFRGSQADRAILERPHWNRTLTQFDVTTEGDAWAYASSGDNGLNYSSDPDAPLITPGLVIFKKPDMTPVSANLSVVGGRHPVLGLGLGDILDPELNVSGSGGTLSGRIPDRGRVEVDIRDLRSLEIARLKLSIGAATVVTEYGPFQRFGDAWAPSTAKTTVEMPEEQPWVANYKIETVSLGATTSRQRVDWFKPGYIFVDERVEPPVRFEYSELLRLNGGSTELTASRLLEFSKLKLASQPRIPTTAGEGTRPNWILPGALSVALAALGIFLFRVWRGRKVGSR
jgi:hypothetical protein